MLSTESPVSVCNRSDPTIGFGDCNIPVWLSVPPAVQRSWRSTCRASWTMPTVSTARVSSKWSATTSRKGWSGPGSAAGEPPPPPSSPCLMRTWSSTLAGECTLTVSPRGPVKPGSTCGLSWPPGPLGMWMLEHVNWSILYCSCHCVQIQSQNKTKKPCLHWHRFYIIYYPTIPWLTPPWFNLVNDMISLRSSRRIHADFFLRLQKVLDARSRGADGALAKSLLYPACLVSERFVSTPELVWRAGAANDTFQTSLTLTHVLPALMTSSTVWLCRNIPTGEL